MEAESADLKETQMMINHDEKIYQEYIRALLFDTEQGKFAKRPAVRKNRRSWQIRWNTWGNV